jgi:hypothetical protein
MTEATPVAASPTKLVDASVKVPKQIRDQVAAAEKLRQEMIASPAAPTSAPEAPPMATAPSEVASQQPSLAPTSVPPVSEPEESIEQRYKSLQGRLEQERRNNAAMVERLNSMENLVATMQISGKRQGEPQPVTYQKLLTEQEAQDYGEEMLTVVGKRAREEFMPDFTQLANKIQSLEERLNGVGTVMSKAEQGKVYNALNETVPDWEAINTSEDFKAWLGEPDPYSGMPRMGLLQDAFARHDANRVVRFFQGFTSEATGTPTSPAAQGSSAPPLPNGQGSGKPSLMDYAAPGRARSAPQALSPDKPIYSQAQIARFYADKRVGKYRGREAEAEAVERDIFQAQHEGRIQ